MTSTFNSKSLFRFILAILYSTILISCVEKIEDNVAQLPVTFGSGEECHLCGMLILRFQGPKAQAYRDRDANIKKFCSTMDMFAWYLQPENKPNTNEIYVHDMAQNDWKTPDDTRLINARLAHFVVGSSKKGSMGNTFVSFKLRNDAIDFANQWGGSVVSFKQITIEMTML